MAPPDAERGAEPNGQQDVTQAAKPDAPPADDSPAPGCGAQHALLYDVPLALCYDALPEPCYDALPEPCCDAPPGQDYASRAHDSQPERA